MSSDKQSKNAIRFAQHANPFYFEECALKHIFEPSLCPKPGISAEMLKDYVLANNYPLEIIPASDAGVTGGEEENRTVLRLLALNESDFSGFDWTYLPERLIRADHSYPIVQKQYIAVVQNPAMSYVDILNMPGEVPLCVAAAAFLALVWVLRKKRLRLTFPLIYAKGIMLNWEVYNLIFGIILSYFTGITVKILI